nr:MAG TPA: hypothetical protein [Bacteriophage sp.]
MQLIALCPGGRVLRHPFSRQAEPLQESILRRLPPSL